MNCKENCACQPSHRRGEEVPIINWSPEQKTSRGALEEEDGLVYDQGFAEGFKKAREVFWLEFQVKASDANMVAKYLNKSDKTSIEADAFRITAAVYLHAADVLLRDRREYPGYLEDDDCF